MDVEEFYVARGIDKEPTFSWWAPHASKKRNAIASVVTSSARKVSHKHGVELPSTVEQDHAIHKKNDNTFLKDKIEK